MSQTPLEHVEAALDEMTPMDIPKETFEYCDSLKFDDPTINPMITLRDHLNDIKRDVERGRDYMSLDDEAHCAVVVLSATELDDTYDPSDLYADT